MKKLRLMPLMVLALLTAAVAAFAAPIPMMPNAGATPFAISNSSTATCDDFAMVDNPINVAQDIALDTGYGGAYANDAAVKVSRRETDVATNSQNWTDDGRLKINFVITVNDGIVTNWTNSDANSIFPLLLRLDENQNPVTLNANGANFDDGAPPIDITDSAELTPTFDAHCLKTTATPTT